MSREWVLITGASGGFGTLFAHAFAARGYALLLHGRRVQALKQLAEALPVPAEIVVADLAEETALGALIQAARAKPLVGLVNNAGFGRWGAFSALELAEHRAVWRVDFEAPMALVHALLPELRKRRGFIVQVSSLAGETPLPWMASYGAAKAALTSLSEALRAEVGKEITIVTLAPGPSPTGFRKVSGYAGTAGRWFSTPPARVVDACLRALDRGGGFVVPGWRHKLLFALQHLVPRALAARIAQRRLARR